MPQAEAYLGVLFTTAAGCSWTDGGLGLSKEALVLVVRKEFAKRQSFDLLVCILSSPHLLRYEDHDQKNKIQAAKMSLHHKLAMLSLGDKKRGSVI